MSTPIVTNTKTQTQFPVQSNNFTSSLNSNINWQKIYTDKGIDGLTKTIQQLGSSFNLKAFWENIVEFSQLSSFENSFLNAGDYEAIFSQKGVAGLFEKINLAKSQAETLLNTTLNLGQESVRQTELTSKQAEARIKQVWAEYERNTRR